MTDDRHLPMFLRLGKEPTPVRNHHLNGATPSTAYAAAAFQDELNILRATPEGQRNHQLNASAYNLAQLVASGALDRDDTWSALYEAARTIGLSASESTATLRSAFRAGGLQPRYVANVELPAAPPASVFQPNGYPDRDVNGEPFQDPVDDPWSGEEPPTLRERFPALDWADLWADDTTDEWIIEPLLPARRLVALYSAPKVGKSLLMLELAVAIARGTEALGFTLSKSRRVLYVDFENDPRGDIRTRLQAMGRGPEELANLVYLSYPRLPFLDTYSGGLELLEVCREYGVEVVVIDTISRAVGGEENENDTWLGFYKHTGLALKAEGISVIRLDHTGKDPTKGMRGGSAKYGDVDAVWSMTALNDTTFRLECTANRLPITEKTLLLERHADPLRHAVTTKRTADVWREQELDLMGHLDRLGVARSAGRPTCEDALRDAGIPWNGDRLQTAVRDRKKGLHAVTAFEELDQPFGPGLELS